MSRFSFTNLFTDIGYKIGLCCGAGVIAIAVFASIQTKKEEPKQEVQVPQITEDVMLDSMVRAWTDPKGQRFMKVCYDGHSNGKYGFFVLYGPKGPSDSETSLDEGWWYVEQEFFRTSAGKYYTNDIPSLDRNMHVYPDVTGLSCKDR